MLAAVSLLGNLVGVSANSGAHYRSEPARLTAASMS